MITSSGKTAQRGTFESSETYVGAYGDIDCDCEGVLAW